MCQLSTALLPAMQVAMPKTRFNFSIMEQLSRRKCGTFHTSQKNIAGYGACMPKDTRHLPGTRLVRPSHLVDIFYLSSGELTLRLGCGASDHPDGLFEVQTQGIVEAARYLAGLLKQGHIGGTVYAKVAYIGFSIGSVAGVSLTAQYPDAVDAVILHGYSWDVTNLYPGYLAGLQAPVNTLEKPEWRNISSLYQSQSTRQSRQAVVFYGDFDPAIVPVDFELRDMDALGLALSFGYHLVTSPQFTGPVFIGDGNRKFAQIHVPNVLCLDKK